MEGFFRDICTFNKGSLKPVKTCVKTADGRSFVESKDGTGRLLVEACSSPHERSLGFVPDLTPDLQMGEVLPGLFVGSQDAAADLPLLQSRGVTHVVNAAGSSVPEIHGRSLSYLSLPLLDLPECVLSDTVIGTVGDFVDGALSTGGAVLIHCNAGVSRSSALAIAFLMTRRRVRFEVALSMVRAVRPAACPNEGFRRQLRDLDVRLGHC
ncbi:unnamed protein product [Ixodes hexagonus]